MDVDQPEVEEYSGLVYEISNEGLTTSHGKAHAMSCSRFGLIIGSGRSVSIEPENRSIESNSGPSKELAMSPDAYIKQDAAAWAAKFQPPSSPGDIKTPRRREVRAKRKPPESHQVRLKRLKPYYSYEHRDLLNTEIQEAASRATQDNLYSLPSSQIGSSIWTTEEKHLFFPALASLGRDNIRGIANRIPNKSEFEVREYIFLLQRHYIDTKLRTKRLLPTSELPTAAEISEECCNVLERAADAIGAHQECAEANKEQEKWGDDMWLVTAEVCTSLGKRRRNSKGEEDIESIFPVANFFILSNWIELSQRVFMNPGIPCQVDNWKVLAEPGETPAVRATAFEDFHSLAVSITKRLVSATIFCAMSRQKAKKFMKRKYADINPNDVEAAVKILGLKSNSLEFWKGCARRCNLDVIDEVEDGKSNNHHSNEESYMKRMTYDEFESAMSFSYPRRSSTYCSRSPGCSMTFSDWKRSKIIISDTDDSFALDDDRDGSDTQLMESDAQEHVQELAEELYLNDYDKRASRREELRLWEIVGQEPPFEIDVDDEPIGDVAEQKVDTTEGENWRDYLEFWSEWETLDTRVSEDAFSKNRVLKSPNANATYRTVDHLDESPDGFSAAGASQLSSESGQESASSEDDFSRQDVNLSRLSSPSNSTPYDVAIRAHFQNLAANFHLSSDGIDDRDFKIEQ